MIGDMAQSERQFVIVTPRQSVGPPGTKVYASQLGMNDEKLDEWVDAGHATEIYSAPTRRAKPVEEVTKVTRAGKSDGPGDDK